MKSTWSLVLLLCLDSAVLAQQSQNGLAGTTVPRVQASGETTDRPGGISYVTRKRPMAGNINLANSFWAAGGVPGATGTGTAGASSTAQVNPGVARVIPAARPVTDPRAVAALRQLAARGDVSAKRSLASMGASGR